MFDLSEKLAIERYFFINHFCIIVYVQKFESVLKTQSAKKFTVSHNILSIARVSTQFPSATRKRKHDI